MKLDQTHFNLKHQDKAKELPAGEAEVDLPRRTVLRGALALGCSLCLPLAFSGCDAKKESDTTTPVPESPPASDMPADMPDSSPESAAPAAANKMSQASVQYQDQPKGDQKCSGCIYFVPESNTCTVVEGQISPDGWCMLWVKKA